MQLNLLNSGTFLFISDHCHVIENVRRTSFCHPRVLTFFKVARWYTPRMVSPVSLIFYPNPGYADASGSDHAAWFQSTQRLKRLEATTKGRVIPGHDKETFLQLQSEIKEYLS